MKWKEIKSNEDLPPIGEERLFDGEEEPPVWAKITMNGKHPCLIVMDSSGEEEYIDVNPYTRYLDESEEDGCKQEADYWKKRCMAAEEFIALRDPSQINANQTLQEIKQWMTDVINLHAEWQESKGGKP